MKYSHNGRPSKAGNGEVTNIFPKNLKNLSDGGGGGGWAIAFFLNQTNKLPKNLAKKKYCRSTGGF